MAEVSRLTVIGGGSTYTPELIDGLIRRAGSIQLRNLVLMDVNEERLAVVGNFARRMIEWAGLTTRVHLLTELGQALEGADFIITQMRVGGMKARAIDERIPLRWGVIGQETTGPGGFAMALRTVPAIQEILLQVARYCPDAWILNFANPSGLITEAIHKLGHAKVVGLCNGPINMVRRLAAFLEVPLERVFVRYFGLNHLGWIDRVYVGGVDVTKRALELTASTPGASTCDPEVILNLGMIPNSYLQYYYHTNRKLEEQRKASKSRAEQVMEIEDVLLQKYGNQNLREKPAELEQRGGAWYSEVAASILEDLVNDRRQIHIVNVLNQGAIQDLPGDSVVEVPALIQGARAIPLTIGCLPVSVRGLVQAVKAYEQLTIEAALTGDRTLAIQALLAHPLVPSAEVATGLVKELLEAHKANLPQFRS